MSARDFFDPKTIFINVSLQKSFLRYSRLLAAAIIILGLIPFIGWLLNSEYITRLLPTLPQMRPTTSMQFIMIGSALLCLTYPRKRIVYLTKDLLAFLVALLGMVTLYEFRENKAIIVSQLVNPLLQVRLPDDFLIIPPTVSILFILSSLAILLVDTWKKRNFFQYLILLAGIVILPSIIEHFYGIDFIYGFALHTKMSLHVTIGMIFLS